MAAAANNVCEACWDARRGHLESLPQLWFGLHSLLEPSPRAMQPDPIPAGRARSRPPLQICVLATLHEVPTAMAFWANGLLAVSGQPPLEPQGLRWGALLSKAITVLEAGDHILRLDQQARLYLAELVTLARRMQMLATLDPLITRIKAPCPACASTAMPLLRDTVTQRVACPSCRQGWEHGPFMAVVLAKAGKGLT